MLFFTALLGIQNVVPILNCYYQASKQPKYWTDFF